MRRHPLALVAIVLCLGCVTADSRADEFEQVEERFQTRLDARTNDQLSQMAQLALQEQIQVLRARETEAQLANRPQSARPAARAAIAQSDTPASSETRVARESIDTP